jgi:hypothetical protein
LVRLIRAYPTGDIALASWLPRSAHGAPSDTSEVGSSNIEIESLFKDSQYGDGSKPWYLVNPKIAGKWMFIPLKMVLIGIDPYPYLRIYYNIHGVFMFIYL